MERREIFKTLGLATVAGVVAPPPDQMRQWVGEWPADLKMDPAALLGTPPNKK